MSQRNPNNDRYKDGGKKGVTKKAAGRAKPKSTAGSSVYVASKETLEKRKAAKEKEEAKKASGSKKAQDRDAAVIAKGEKAADDYTHYRNLWIAMLVIAVIAITITFIAPRVMVEGGALAALEPYKGPVQIGGLVFGYAAIIAAFVIDWRKMRPVRKAQYTRSKGVKESKKQRAHREAAEAAKAEKKSFFSRKK